MVSLDSPVNFDGPWTTDEQEQINAVVRPHADYYAAIFDAQPSRYWRCIKYQLDGAGAYRFMAQKVTRPDEGIVATTVAELAEKMAATYRA